jgi:MFS family permease
MMASRMAARRQHADADWYWLTPPDRRGAVFGLFGLHVMVAPAIGPLLSGYLLQHRTRG